MNIIMSRAKPYYYSSSRDRMSTMEDTLGQKGDFLAVAENKPGI